MYFTISTGLTIENDQSKQKGHLGFFFAAVAYTKLMFTFFFHDQIAQRKYFEYEELDPITDVLGVLQSPKPFLRRLLACIYDRHD